MPRMERINVSNSIGGGALGQITPVSGMPTNLGQITAVDGALCTVGSGTSQGRFTEYANNLYLDAPNASGYGWPTGVNCEVFGADASDTTPAVYGRNIGSGTMMVGGTVRYYAP